MAVTPDKYERLEILLERSEYKRLFMFVQERGWTFAYFIRIAIAEGIEAQLLKESKEQRTHDWSKRKA